MTTTDWREVMRNLIAAVDRERTADMDDAEEAAKLYMQRRAEALALLAEARS